MFKLPIERHASMDNNRSTQGDLKRIVEAQIQYKIATGQHRTVDTQAKIVSPLGAIPTPKSD